MSLRTRLARLENRLTPKSRILAVNLYRGETPADAFAAEYPGAIPAAADVVVVTATFPDLTRMEARARLNGVTA